MDTLLPRIKLSLDDMEMWRDGVMGNIFTSPSLHHSITPPPLWLEIGFGGGEHLAHQAALHPNIGMIGCEPYENGMADMLKHIDTHKLDNIRVFSDDARLLMEKLPEASIERVFILYPDPWPKSRHHKRRLVSTETLDMVARILKPGGLLRLATDHEGYATWILERLLAHNNFSWTANSCEDWLNPPSDWISTRYEQKALAGRPTYLEFKRE